MIVLKKRKRAWFIKLVSIFFFNRKGCLGQVENLAGAGNFLCSIGMQLASFCFDHRSL